MEILLCSWIVGLALAAVVICVAYHLFVKPVRVAMNFAVDFPPITDDEFMARLPAGTNRDIALKVRRIVADQFNVKYERISPETSFVNDLGAD